MNNLDDAHELIDTAISTALKESKPVYISISCNLPGIPHPTFAKEPVPYFLAPQYVFFTIIYSPSMSRIVEKRVSYALFLNYTDFAMQFEQSVRVRSCSRSHS